MGKMIKIAEYFEDIQLTKEYNGYFCSISDALTIVILGSICGLRNVHQIHVWTESERIKEFLAEHFNIKNIPCYYWLLCLLKMIDPKSFNQCFIKWVQSFLSDKSQKLTLSFDGKTIRSTEKMEKYDSPLHIISAQIGELGITLGQQTINGKSNEIPAMRELLQLLDIKGCIVVADALNCQKKTAESVREGGGDYLFNVKDNQSDLKEEIATYVHDDILRGSMDSYETVEKNSGRIEKRVSYVSNDIDWLYNKKEWKDLKSIGAVNRQITTKKGVTNEWHYYISSSVMTAEEFLKHIRLEWSVESMHWLLDVHFGEDFCRVEDKNIQQNLNMVRKVALNSIKVYKEKTKSKRSLSGIMLMCLIEHKNILNVLSSLEVEN